MGCSSGRSVLCVLAAVMMVTRVTGQVNYEIDSEPLTIYFEREHYLNKASEPGFCEQACATDRVKSVVQKPGRCPNSLSAALDSQLQTLDCSRPPRHQCRYDSECPDRQRCCSVGHCEQRRCVEPDFRLTCADLQCGAGSACVDRPSRAAAGHDARCVSTVDRAGRCPAAENPLVTRPQCKSQQDECDYDEECAAAGDKCCQTECGRRCQQADLRVSCEDLTCGDREQCVEYPPRNASCVDTEPRPGQCPKVSASGVSSGRYIGSCTDQCHFDSECDDDHKCCHNGCALQCLRKRRPDCDTIKCKVGEKCQEDFRGQPQCQPIPCEQDGQVVDIECNSCTCIQGFLLCSQEECPPVKPGFCPRLVRGYRGRCAEECSRDYDCSGEEKCCSSGCGHVCKQPAPAIIHPCKTVRFRCGDNTHCAATRGLCQPGKPCPLVPLCVSRNVPFCDSCPEGKVCILQKKPCPQGHCQRQPICVQLYSDDTPFQENEAVEEDVVARQQRERNNLV